MAGFVHCAPGVLLGLVVCGLWVSVVLGWCCGKIVTRSETFGGCCSLVGCFAGLTPECLVFAV